MTQAAQYAVGIDLGTTQSALAYKATGSDDAPVELLAIPQLVAAATTEERHTMPSFLYLATDDVVVRHDVARAIGNEPRAASGWSLDLDDCLTELGRTFRDGLLGKFSRVEDVPLDRRRSSRFVSCAATHDRGNRHAHVDGLLRLLFPGWRAKRCEVPEWTGSDEAALVVAPAEVELS